MTCSCDYFTGYIGWLLAVAMPAYFTAASQLALMASVELAAACSIPETGVLGDTACIG